MPPSQRARLPGQLKSLPHRFTGDYQIGLYGINRANTCYFHGSGKLLVPVQGPAGTPAEVVDVDAPYGGKVVKFEVTRFALMPLYPGKETSDPNFVYLNGEVSVDAPAVVIDGANYWYGVSGWYLYGALKPLEFGTDGLPMGVTTLDRTDPADNVLPAAACVDTKATLKGRPARGDDVTVLRQLLPRAMKQ